MAPEPVQAPPSFHPVAAETDPAEARQALLVDNPQCLYGFAAA